MRSKMAFFALSTIFVTILIFFINATDGGATSQVDLGRLAAPVASLGTAFTYQGYLESSGSPVNDTCDLQFKLWDALNGGARVGQTQTSTNVIVDDGLFTVQLDFGSAFSGDARWLEIAVRCPAGSGSYTTLSPRPALAAAPYALYSLKAPWSGLSGVPAGFADGTDDGLTSVTWTDIQNRPVGLDDGDDDTTYSAGTGLLLNGGVFSLNSAYALPQSCNSGEIPEWNGSDWECGTDDIGSSVDAWSLTGNSGTTPGTNFLGTTDGQPLELRVNSQRALRLEPAAGSPNLIGGYSGNGVLSGVKGATIGGGGEVGSMNLVADDYGTVGGGIYNRAGDYAGTTNDAQYATVGGGAGNEASGGTATVGGGDGNIASGNRATVAGGTDNWASGSYATVGGGDGNIADGDDATVGGGYANTASGESATVSGGWSNSASVERATVSGGEGNTASGSYATVGGGAFNDASGATATVGGGYHNLAVHYATVGGGYHNLAVHYATVGGGASNSANGPGATVGGGDSNSASGSYATVGGGYVNTASGESATVGGGLGNTASVERATVGGGEGNTASNYYATVGGGDYASVPAGFSNTAAGYASFAAGYRAGANHAGSFVWADSHDYDFSTFADNGFKVRATGGVRIVVGIDETAPGPETVPTWQCTFSNGSSWTCSSSRSLKENLTPVDGRETLERLRGVLIYRWNGKGQDPAVTHIGPTSEDFYAAFDVGENDSTIATIDLDGVALAAIQGLYELAQEKDAQIATLQQQVAELQQHNASLEARLTALEQAVGVEGAPSQPPASDLPAAPIFFGGLFVVTLVLAQRWHAGGRS